MEKAGLGIFTPFQCGMVSGCLREEISDVALGLMIIFDIFRPCKLFLLELIPIFTWV